jgi:hypothetical protein
LRFFPRRFAFLPACQQVLHARLLQSKEWIGRLAIQIFQLRQQVDT